MELVSSPVRLNAGSKVATVPSGTIPLEEPSRLSGEYFALLSTQLYEGYRIVKLKQIDCSNYFGEQRQ